MIRIMMYKVKLVLLLVEKKRINSNSSYHGVV